MSNSNITNETITSITSILTSGAGRFTKVAFKSTPKPAAAFKAVQLTKVTRGVFRAGINFANLTSVKEGIANEERGEVQPLPWGAWVTFPYTISHKGVEYVRLYPAVNGKVEVQYLVNGEEVTKEEFKTFLTPSAATSGAVECFTVKAENILSVE